MARIHIDRLIPTSGAEPQEDYDAVSLVGFTLWQVGDEARFSTVVPDTYVTGTDFSLNLLESSPSVSVNHQWQVKATLFRPGVHVTDEPTFAETRSAEFQSPSTGEQLTLRTIQTTGSAEPGEVSGLAMQSGDYVSWTLTRMAASQAEDPEPIKILDMSLEVSIAQTAVSDCPGRVGRIIDTVRDLFNEANGGFISDEFILRSMNRCLQDLAQDNYWRTETWVACESGEYRVDLLSAVSAFQALHQVRYSGSRTPMIPLGSYLEFDQMRCARTAQGIPEYYVVQNTDLLVWPPPSGTEETGLYVYHSYLPDELGCSADNANPPIPKAHDMVFVYFVLKQAFLRDRHAPGADAKFQEYSVLYDKEKQALLGQGGPPLLSLRPHR